MNDAERWRSYSSKQRWGYLAVLFLVVTSNYFDYFVVSVVLEPIKHEFHASDTMLGLLNGFCFASSYAITALPFARWADQGNRKQVLTLALTGWSVMTLACGAVGSFWQLALARVGVGATQPGALPTAQSLTTDFFPPQRRATAIAILNAGTAAGYLTGVGLGGVIAAAHGWRHTFIVAGAAGLILAMVVSLVLDEPRRSHVARSPLPDHEPAGLSLMKLRKKRSFVGALIGISVYTVFAYGINTFLPAFMMRALQASLEQVSLLWGFTISAATILGTLGGGWLADRLGQKDIRWYSRLPAIACLASAPLYWLALSAHDLWTFIVYDFAAEAILSIGIPVSFVVIHTVCGNQRRALAITVVQLAVILIGCGLGPLLAGLMSDGFSSLHGPQGIRVSLIVMVVFLLPAALAFLRTSRFVRQESEDWKT